MTKISNACHKARWMPMAATVMAALAGSASPGLPAAGSFATSGGPAFITGTFGAMQTTTLPGSAGQGLLMSNGNGTSTLLAPGVPPQVVATPR